MRLLLGVALVALVAWPSAAQTPVGDSSGADRIAAERVQAPSADPVVEAKTRAVSAQLRCPVCQGLSVQDSPSELAQEMKAVVREQIMAGKSESEVKAFFVAKYGEWILLQPEASGFNLLVYILPFVALLVGAGLVVVVVRRWTRAGGATADVEAALLPAIRDEVDGRAP